MRRLGLRSIRRLLPRIGLTLAATVLILTLAGSNGSAFVTDPWTNAPDRPPADPITVTPHRPPSVPAPALGRLLVVIDHFGSADAEQKLASGAAIVLHHFARETDWKYVDDLDPSVVRAADAVVYFGTSFKVSGAGWQSLRYAKRLVATNLHLPELQRLGFFPHVTSAFTVDTPAGAEIVYNGQHFAAGGSAYMRFFVKGDVRTLGSIGSGRMTPFAVVDGNAAFIAAPLTFSADVTDPYKDGFRIAAVDALRIALGAPALPRVALLRLEDVSVQVPTSRMRSIVQYLESRQIAYGIGVIPDQLINGVTLKSLPEDPGLVAVLRYAEAHGARIILHGFHHSFNSPEDFEFWDNEHNRPLPEDSIAWMSEKLNAGLAIERGLGLHPVMWESPHYSASPLDYGVVGKFFAASWERRRPVAFSPWPLDQDGYGSVLLPENIGYVAVRGELHMTLKDALARAKAFTVCGDCVVSGFLHPATVALADVVDYVNGIEDLGYRFVDPLSLVAPRETP